MRKSAKFDTVRLQHMLDAARTSQQFVAGQTRASLESDELLAFAMARAVEIVGEAASQITDELRSRNPQIKWSDIINMRNRLAHAYFKINLDVLWDSVNDDMPPLIAELERILAEADA